MLPFLQLSPQVLKAKYLSTMSSKDMDPENVGGSGCFALPGLAFTREQRPLMSLPHFFGSAQQNKETSSFQAWLGWTKLSAMHSTEHVTTGRTFPTRTRKNGFSPSLEVPKEITVVLFLSLLNLGINKPPESNVLTLFD